MIGSPVVAFALDVDIEDKSADVALALHHHDDWQDYHVAVTTVSVFDVVVGDMGFVNDDQGGFDVDRHMAVDEGAVDNDVDLDDVAVNWLTIINILWK